MVEQNEEDKNEAEEENQIEVVETTFIGENMWKDWSDEKKDQRKREIFALAAAYTYFTQHSDEFRHELASEYGGFELRDKAQQDLLRSAFSELLTVVGRKILNGDFNLTRISFPIRCMAPQSVLMQTTGFASTLPVYMNKAATITDPVERMKLVMTSNFSWYLYNQVFHKPLNPILGETYEAIGQDGAKIFLEQTSHHPPRSHLFVDGPDGLYTMNGYTEYEIYAGLQNSDVNCIGFKQVTFADGGKIKWNLNNDHIGGIVYGAMTHQLTGRVTYTDEQNDLIGYYNYNGYWMKKQDFVWGEITQGGERVSEVIGNYTGYLDFDGVRYWDAREKDSICMPIAGEEPQALPSQASKRTDGRFFISKTLDEAQTEKERLENLQRHDRKLREACEKRRAKGGPKFKSQEEEKDEDE